MAWSVLETLFTTIGDKYNSDQRFRYCLMTERRHGKKTTRESGTSYLRNAVTRNVTFDPEQNPTTAFPITIPTTESISGLADTTTGKNPSIMVPAATTAGQRYLPVRLTIIPPAKLPTAERITPGRISAPACPALNFSTTW